MASRGRGRGGRGGRSGGRGGMQAPTLRDDDGNFVEADRNEGPPPLFPAIELKSDPPEPTPQDKLLLLRRSDLKRYHKSSPYYIELKADAATSNKRTGAARDADDLERYSDRFNKRAAVQQQKPPLATILTLHPHHFPEELFSDRDKRLAARGAGSGADLFKRAPAADPSSIKHHLDNLAAKEQEKGAGGDAGPGQAAAAEGEQLDDEAGVTLDDEDDDDVMQEDDYYQGEYFDDDEGYDDYDDGGGDDGAVY